MPVGISPTWWKQGGFGSLSTCDHIANSKSTQVFFMVNSTCTDSPAYIPIADNGNGAAVLADNRQTPWPFHHNLFPGFYRRASMHINTNSLSSGFQLWLARDGPTQGRTSAVPVKLKKIFDIPLRTEPEYTTNNFFPNKGSALIPMFSGRDYGYMLTTEGDVLPSGSIQFSIWTSIYYGGAGS